MKRCVLDERDVMNFWRSLFHGKEITKRSLTKAGALLDGLSGESPLHIRLAKELEDIRKLLQNSDVARQRPGVRGTKPLSESSTEQHRTANVGCKTSPLQYIVR